MPTLHANAADIDYEATLASRVARTPSLVAPNPIIPCINANATDGHSRGILAPQAVRDQRMVWWGFCLLWLGGTWPYQALLQAQAYYSKTMSNDFGFLNIMAFSWPLFALHIFNVLSGAAKAAGFSRRIYAAFAISAAIGVVFVLQNGLSMRLSTRRTVILVLAATMAVAQVLLEPALFGLAGLMAMERRVRL